MDIRKNTLINLGGSIAPMAVMLVTVPLYLRILGEARYGVLALVWLILGYFSFLEMGLGKATANQIAKAREATAAERSEIFWSALLVNASMGMVGAGILWLTGDYLISTVLKMPEDFRREAAAALPWMTATLPLALVASVLNGALEGRNQFMAVNLLQVCTNAIFQIVPLIVAYWLDPSLAWVIPAAVASRATMTLFFLLACYRHVPLVNLPRISMHRVRSLLSYGGWVAITGIAGPLLDTVERFMVGMALGASAVTHYTVPMQLVGKLKILPGGLARALFPVFSSVQRSAAHELAVTASNWLALTMAWVVITGALTLRPFLDLWIGRELTQIASPIGEILLAGIWINSVATIPYFYLQATGRPDLVAKLHAAELLPYLVLTWVSINQFGLIGAAVVWILRCAVEALVLFSMAEMAGQVVVGIAVTSGAVVSALTAIWLSPEASVLFRISAASMLAITGLLATRYFLGISPVNRSLDLHGPFSG